MKFSTQVVATTYVLKPYISINYAWCNPSNFEENTYVGDAVTATYTGQTVDAIVLRH